MMEREPLNLYLIRHGETAWSLSGQHTGSSEISLTPRGEAQARALAAHLRGVHFSKVLCSPRERARRTCELAGYAATAEITADLAEWDYGSYEGRRTADIRREQPAWDLWLDGGPGGELPADIATRADRLIGHVATLEGNVALFSHGHFSCALAVRWIGSSISAGRHFVLDPASVSVLGYPAHHAQTRALLLWNAPALWGSENTD